MPVAFTGLELGRWQQMAGNGRLRRFDGPNVHAISAESRFLDLSVD